jgi:hypothetical protein
MCERPLGGDDYRPRREIMARIIVTPDDQRDVVLLDERVNPIHLTSELSSRQVIERLAWAVKDAHATERDKHEGRVLVDLESK